MTAAGCAHAPPVASAPTHAVVSNDAKTPEAPGAVSPELGAPDRALPTAPAKPDAFVFVAKGSARPYGHAAKQRARPDAPGRGGGLLVAIDTPYQLHGRSSSYVHLAAWTPDGRPAAGADVFLGRKGIGRTDRHGTLVFRPKTTALQEDALFVIAEGDKCGAANFVPYLRTASFASEQLYVYTDRGVFRPGETVHVRMIGWQLRDDYAPMHGADVELRLRDREGHTLVAAEVKTDAFGTGAADLVVPRDAELGDYELEVAHGTALESARLQIRRFQTPVLRIEHDLPRWLGTDTTALSFTVSAHPAAGGVLGKATIVARLTAPDGRSTSVRREVNGSGRQAFTVDGKAFAPLREQLVDGARLAVDLEVTDARGRSDTVHRAIVFADQPWTAVLEPDRDGYAPGDRVSVVARISDRDDAAMRDREIALVLSPSGKRVTAKTDGRGMASFDFVMPAATQRIALYEVGRDRPLAEAELPLVAPVPLEVALAKPIVRERSAVDVVVRFPLGHVPVDRRVHLDLTDTSGAIVGAAVLRAAREDGAWVARGRFTAPTWGSALVTFFALGKAPSGGAPGLLVGGHQLAVQAERALDITLEGVPERAAPGAQLDVRATVRSADGKSRPFAASATLVDRAVLAMNDPLEVSPLERFYDPELRTLATTGAQMLTWPVVTRNWGGDRWDIALPPFSFHDGGERAPCADHYDERDFAALEGNEVSVNGYGSGGGAGTMGSGSVGLVGVAGRGGTQIVVRTRLDDTSLWLPDLRGTGDTRFGARLPEGTGEQELVVVASDAEGGVGIARRTIAVTQPLFVRPELPDTMVAGEVIEVPVVVHNATAKADDVALEWSVGGKTSRTRLKVPAMRDADTELSVAMASPGTLELRVQATGNTEADAAVHRATVRPRGIPLSRREVGTLDADGRARFEIDRVAGVAEDGHLAIVWPTRAAAGTAAASLLADIVDDPWAVASDLAAAAAIVRHAGAEGGPAIARLRASIGAAIGMLARVQDPSGAWAYWRNGRASAWVTAVTLDGLLEARAAGFDVPAATITDASGFLVDALQGDVPLLPAAELGWWEGDELRVREGLTAEVFAILARTPEADRSKPLRALLERLSDRHREALRAHTLDVRAAAHAVLAMHALGSLDAPDAALAVKDLLAVRDHGHWEPTWLSAYGGTIEATAAVVEVLAAVGGTDHALELRDAVRWLAATRPSWGQWHNERGTTAAIRALARLGAPADTRPSRVTVRVDGVVAVTQQIDPADPVGSMLALGHVELPNLEPGKHIVEVEHDGELDPSVVLIGRRWKSGAGSAGTVAGHSLDATASHALDVGVDTSLRVVLEGPRLGGASVRVAKSGLVELDLDRLGAEVGRGRTIANVRDLGDAIELGLGPDASSTSLVLPVRVLRRGRGHWPSVALRLAPARTKGQGDEASRTIVVEPGSIAVR